MRVRRIDQIILYVAVAANLVGFGVVLSLLADLQDAYGFPTAGLGLIAGSSFVAAFVAFIWLAHYADRGHAKAMMMASLVVGAGALIVTAFARNLWVFVAARALLGLSEGVFMPAARRVVLDWNPERPGEALGRVFAASAGGFALGPVIGALLADRFGLQVPFLVPAGVLLAVIPVVACLRPVAPLRTASVRRAFSVLLGSRLVIAGVLIGSVDYLVVGAFDAVWARLLVDRGASTLFVGLSFLLIAVPIIGLAPRFGRLVDRLSPGRVAAFGTASLLMALVGYGWLGPLLLLGFTVLLHGLGAAAIAPAGAALVARGSPTDMLARGQGVLEAVGFLVAAGSAFFAGWAYEALGRGALWTGVAAVALGLFAAGWWVARPLGLPAARHSRPSGQMS